MKKHITDLGQEIIDIRAKAGKIYDDAISKGIKPEAIVNLIEPVQKELDKHIMDCVNSDLGKCVMAVRRLVDSKRMFDGEAQFLIGKGIDANHYAETIKNAIKAHMKLKGVETMSDGQFSAVLTKVNGVEDVVLR